MKTILKRISAGALAAVFLASFAVPRSKAVVEGFDIVAVANAVVDTHLAALGGEFVIKTGGSSALAAGTESLFTQAGAAGAFGAGVTGATAMGTIAAGVVAFGGGFVLGYEGYQVVTQFVEWLKENKLISADEANKIYQTGGSPEYLLDGSKVAGEGSPVYVYGRLYTTQAGSSFTVEQVQNGFDDNGRPLIAVKFKAISYFDDFLEYTTEAKDFRWYGTDGNNQPLTTYRVRMASSIQFQMGRDLYAKRIYLIPEIATTDYFKDYFGPVTDVEKQEVTYTSPATWTPPTPKPGQSVLYKPFPDAPDKGLEDIIADVPEAIASSNFKPAATTVIDTPTPEPPPTPDVPPTVNPNPDVQAPEDVTPYTVKIGEVFPFCIPFDLYHMVTMFSAEPEAPNGKWEFYLPWEKQDPHPQLYKVEWDLEKFDDLAELCRKLELVLFCVGLAVVTSKLIKW